jgi:hypothetical protein
MIGIALDYVVKEIRNHTGLGVGVVDAIGVHTLKDTPPDKLGVSLVSVDEETALRNTDHVLRNGASPRYQQPPVHLNLYVLVWCSFAYATSLTHLSSVIELFQHKRYASVDNQSAANPFPAGLERLLFELQDASFEQMHYVWGMAGGSYLPSVLYKVRLIRIQKAETAAAPPIQVVEVDTVKA